MEVARPFLLWPGNEATLNSFSPERIVCVWNIVCVCCVYVCACATGTSTCQEQCILGVLQPDICELPPVQRCHIVPGNESARYQTEQPVGTH